MTGIDLGAGGGAGNQNSDPANNAGGSGAGNGGAPNGGNSGGGDNAPWYAATFTDDAHRTLAQNKGWKSPDEMAKSYANLEADYSKRAPAKAPAKAADYKFTAPKDIPGDFKLDDGLTNAFREFAHKNDISQDTAASMYNWYVENAAGAYTMGQQRASESIATRVTGTHEALVKDWGDPKSPGFQRNVEMSRRAIGNLDPGLKDALVELGAITKMDGKEMVTNATVFKALAKVGDALYSEDKQFATPASDFNPFAAEHENKPGAMEMMGRLIREDPQKAATLIKAAGRQTEFSGFLSRTK